MVVERVYRIGVSPEQDGVQEQAVAVRVVAGGRREILVARGGRQDVGDDVGDTDAGGRDMRPDGADREAVGQVEVMRGSDGVREMPATGCMDAALVAQECLAPRFVDGDPVGGQVTQSACRPRGEVREPFSGIPQRPTPRILEDLRQLPVIERHEGAHAEVTEPPEERSIEIEPHRVERTPPRGLEAGPGDREPIRGVAELADEVHVLAPAVVVVARDVARVAVDGAARRMREGVPDRRCPSPLRRAALDLVGGRGGTPQEPGREACGEDRCRAGGRGCHGAVAERGHAACSVRGVRSPALAKANPRASRSSTTIVAAPRATASSPSVPCTISTESNGCRRA